MQSAVRGLVISLVLSTAVACGMSGGTGPTETLQSFYNSLASHRYGDACKLIDPKFLVRLPVNCATALAQDYGNDDFRGVKVNPSKIKVSGDTASARGAVTWPAQDESSVDEDLAALVKVNGKWLLSLDFGNQG